MNSSHAYDHRGDIITYLEQIGFTKKYLFPEKQVII